MQVELLNWNASEGPDGQSVENRDADLVMYFGQREALAGGRPFDKLCESYPEALLIGCSTGGQILDNAFGEDDMVTAAIRFSDTKLQLTSADIRDPNQSYACGKTIGADLKADGLAGIFVLSDGTMVNGSDLAEGIADGAGENVPIVGGLAGDGDRFEETLVGAGDRPRSGKIGAIGFYGNAIRFGHGSEGGWDVFGPQRKVTRSSGNILYELDGQPALDLYERYLGEEAKQLPGSALLYPLQVWDPEEPDNNVVRTVLNVDREARSMTFAGNVPEGFLAQLMRGNLDRLAAGAAEAARQAGNSVPGGQLAIMISCIGRRLLMGQRVEEEIEAASRELGSEMPHLGFYSYGEICPRFVSGRPRLHNQTMTISVISEHSI
ncbi:hypothetical protein MnTg02_02335 [bacterium MnTg02]|nr:hypothetical protein MnTg02_02335 [bacterium MnTg02]